MCWLSSPARPGNIAAHPSQGIKKACLHSSPRTCDSQLERLSLLFLFWTFTHFPHKNASSCHLSLVGRLELQESADVESNREEDQEEDGERAQELVRGHVRVAHREVALDGHGQGAVDGPCADGTGRQLEQCTLGAPTPN